MACGAVACASTGGGAADESAAPHELQNFAPSLTGEPHCGHNMMTSFLRSSLPLIVTFTGWFDGITDTSCGACERCAIAADGPVIMPVTVPAFSLAAVSKTRRGRTRRRPPSGLFWQGCLQHVCRQYAYTLLPRKVRGR